MKLADRERVWQRAVKRDAGPVNITRLKLNGARGFDNVDLQFAQNITAICGESGAGKTTFLLCLYYALAPAKASVEYPFLKPIVSNLALECTAAVPDQHNGGQKDLSGDDLSNYLSAKEDAHKVVYVDASELAQKLRRVIARDANFSTVLEGLPTRNAAEHELEALREFIGKRYDTLQIFEVEDYATEPPFLYFRATCGQETYGSESMGLGELCINLIFWTLNGAESGSVVLLEEPESHLPPRAQKALMSFLAAESCRNRLNIVLTTHSSFTLEYLPTDNIIMFARLGPSIIAAPKPTRSTLFDSLQYTKRKRLALLCEDNIALQFCKQIVIKKLPSLLEEAEFAFVNGYGDLDEISKRWPGLKDVKMVCLYDGDMRAKTDLKRDRYSVFLPGNSDPALELRGLVLSRGGELASELGIRKEDVGVAIANNTGTDQKDFFPSLMNALGINMEKLISGTTNIWLKSDANSTGADVFLKELKTYV